MPLPTHWLRPWIAHFHQRLYLRIWLAMVGAVALLSLLVAWAWHLAVQDALQNTSPPPRTLVLRDASGQVLLQGQALRQPQSPGQGQRLHVTSDDGRRFELQLLAPDPSAQPLARHRSPSAWWLRPPWGFGWTLGLVSLGVIVGVFPIVRRLLQRLERLQAGVRRWGEGDLSVRVPEHGSDEVAELARQFNAAAARIEALLAAHKSLLAHASHELRSPLARIRMALELHGSGGAQGANARQEMERNIAELDQLVDEILLASRLDTRTNESRELESVDLIGLAAEECARVDAALELAPGTSALELPGEAKLLRRALRNLLENARRYGHSAVELQLQRSATHAIVQVCDHGPGVPVAQRERIFEPFYRLPGASERSGGVGLGLALVRSIAQRHGGQVRCGARPDGHKGACFTLELALQPPICKDAAVLDNACHAAP